LTAAATRTLLAYAWPDNIRELENMMERTAILAGATVDARDLPVSPPDEKLPLLWRDIERQAIGRVLNSNHGESHTGRPAVGHQPAEPPGSASQRDGSLPD
jgi:transcriptional regulator with GAF, ATPase, and Fis domain